MESIFRFGLMALCIACCYGFDCTTNGQSGVCLGEPRCTFDGAIIGAKAGCPGAKKCCYCDPNGPNGGSACTLNGEGGVCKAPSDCTSSSGSSGDCTSPLVCCVDLCPNVQPASDAGVACSGFVGTESVFGVCSCSCGTGATEVASPCPPGTVCCANNGPGALCTSSTDSGECVPTGSCTPGTDHGQGSCAGGLTCCGP